MKRILLLSLFSLVLFTLQSQTVADAVRYAYLQPGGTARFLGAGGAFGSLGADFGVLSTNPAGLALYRTDEFVFTPALRFANTDAVLPGLGNSSWEEQKSNFNFANVGIVFNTEPSAYSKWSTFNVGIGFNRQQNFHQSVFYQGNGNGTILNNWFQNANQILSNGGSDADFYPFEEQLAYDANAIYFQDGVLTYDFFNTPEANTDRSQTLITSGGINEMVFSFAGNYDERFMIGATVGVPFVNYQLEGTYREEDPNGTVDFFDNLEYTEFLQTQGLGVNFKMGVVVRLNQALRLGGAFHTPTFLRLTDDFSNTFAYAYTDGGGSFNNQTFSPDGTFDYRLRTPWRAMASASLLVNRLGFLSADVEWVDYASSRYNFTADVSNTANELFERQINTDINRQLQTAMNVRLGGELVLDIFRLRAGLNLLGKPYEGEDGFNTAYTVGGGIRADAFYLDLGYRRNIGEGAVTAYPGAPAAALDNIANDFLLTVGFKF